MKKGATYRDDAPQRGPAECRKTTGNNNDTSGNEVRSHLGRC